MRYLKTFGFVAMATAGLALSCATAKAQDPYWEQRDLRHDYAKVDRLRSDIARDAWQRDRAVAEGRYRDASRIERDIAHDQRKLDRQLRDIHRDRRDLRYDYYGRPW